MGTVTSPGQVIVLNGPSSSGKSTIAQALQAALPRPFWHVSFDTYRDTGALPMARFRSGDFDWPAHRAQVFAGLHASYAALAQAGNNLIIEHILDTPGWFADLDARFADIPVLFVGVDCDRATLIAREAARGDRTAGSAARDWDTVHRGQTYDLRIKGDGPVDDALSQILPRMAGRLHTGLSRS